MSIFTALEGVPSQKTAGGSGDDGGDAGGGSTATGACGIAAKASGGNGGVFTFRNPGVKAVKSNPNTARFGSRAGNCLLLTVTVICIGVLVLCGVMVVREYTASKDYRSAMCNVVNITYVRLDVACMFCASTEKGKKEKGAGACTRSSFPCVNIKVAYDVRGESFEGQMHTDSLQARGSTAQCSYTVCQKKPEANKAAVEKYASVWWSRRVAAFKCFYDTTDYRRVIETKRHTKSEVIHCMLWPSVIIVICGAIFLHIEMRRRGVTLCRRAEERREDEMAYGKVSVEKGKYSEGKEGQPDAHCRLIDNCGPKYTSGDERRQKGRRREAPKVKVTAAGVNGSERANRHRQQTQPHRHSPTEKSRTSMALPLEQKNSAKGQKGVETPV